jgi:hypothetical protein
VTSQHVTVFLSSHRLQFTLVPVDDTTASPAQAAGKPLQIHHHACPKLFATPPMSTSAAPATHRVGPALQSQKPAPNDEVAPF